MDGASRVENWFAMMERLGEADIPAEVGGMVLTPRQLIQHARANDSVWQQIKNRF